MIQLKRHTLGLFALVLCLGLPLRASAWDLGLDIGVRGTRLVTPSSTAFTGDGTSSGTCIDAGFTLDSGWGVYAAWHTWWTGSTILGGAGLVRTYAALWRGGAAMKGGLHDSADDNSAALRPARFGPPHGLWHGRRRHRQRWWLGRLGRWGVRRRQLDRGGQRRGRRHEGRQQQRRRRPRRWRRRWSTSNR